MHVIGNYDKIFNFQAVYSYIVSTKFCWHQSMDLKESMKQTYLGWMESMLGAATLFILLYPESKDYNDNFN